MKQQTLKSSVVSATRYFRQAITKDPAGLLDRKYLQDVARKVKRANGLLKEILQYVLTSDSCCSSIGILHNKMTSKRHILLRRFSLQNTKCQRRDCET